MLGFSFGVLAYWGVMVGKFGWRTQSAPAPVVMPILPLKPCFLFVLYTIFIIPALPLASYFADGLFIISIFSMAEAGMLSKPDWLPKPVSAVCLPSISTTTLSLPRSCTLPLCTATPGRFCMACSTEPPVWLILSLSKKVFLSIFSLTSSCFATIKSSPSVFFCTSSVLPKFKKGESLPTNNACIWVL